MAAELGDEDDTAWVGEPEADDETAWIGPAEGR
jgi:hypothetical protein